MADIAAGDVTHTVTKSMIGSNSRKEILATIAFGDGALTYPSGGIPITKAQLGLPNLIDEMVLLDPGNSNGYVYKLDLANLKIKIYQAPVQTHAHDFLVKGGTAAAGTDALNIKTVIIGKEAATDATSLAADTATKGGVLSKTLAAAALSEVTAASFAPAATSLKIKATGY